MARIQTLGLNDSAAIQEARIKQAAAEESYAQGEAVGTAITRLLGSGSKVARQRGEVIGAALLRITCSGALRNDPFFRAVGASLSGAFNPAPA
jgi:hypothetical protein